MIDFSKIKLIATDFDGVLTNNKVIHSENGLESVIRSRADSMAVDLLNDAGLYNKKEYNSFPHEVDILIMSRETNKVVKSVADKMKIRCTQSLYSKYEAFKEEIEQRKLKTEQVLYIGNDLNDLECMLDSGISVAVADSHPHILDIAKYTTEAKGGKGAFREVIELIIESRKINLLGGYETCRGEHIY